VPSSVLCLSRASTLSALNGRILAAFVARNRKRLAESTTPRSLPGLLAIGRPSADIFLVSLLSFFLHSRPLEFHTALVAMIDLLSQIVARYLAPALSLTAVLLCLFSFLSPVVMLHSRVSLLSVLPSLELTPTQNGDVDGPSVFLGALGSCARSKNDAPITCTLPVLNPTYDLSVLPGNAPNLLSAPTSTTPAFIAVSLAFSILFFLLFTLIAFRASLGAKLSGMLGKPFLQRASAWIGLLGFMIGLTSFLVIRMWFGKAVEDFNNAVQVQEAKAPALIAEISNGFIMVWVGYAFHAVPLVCSLAKIHVAVEKA